MQTALRNILAVIIGIVVAATQTAGGIYTVNAFPHPEWFTYLGPAVFVPFALMGAWAAKQLRT